MKTPFFMQDCYDQFINKLPLEIWMIIHEINQNEFKAKMKKLSKLQLIQLNPCPYFLNHWTGMSKRKTRNFLMIESPNMQFEVAYSKSCVQISQTFVIGNNVYGYYVTTGNRRKNEREDYISSLSIAL
jgi:hypothetical protein